MWMPCGLYIREVRIALDTEQEKPEGEIYIIPARLEACNVPESLSKWQWVDLFEDGGRRRLIYTLRARAEKVRASLRRHRDTPAVASTPRPKKPKKVDRPTT